jgi:hypothetical protein
MGINDKAPLLAHILGCLGGQFYTEKYQKSVRINGYLAPTTSINACENPEILLLYLFNADQASSAAYSYPCDHSRRSTITQILYYAEKGGDSRKSCPSTSHINRHSELRKSRATHSVDTGEEEEATE